MNTHTRLHPLSLSAPRRALVLAVPAAGLLGLALAALLAPPSAAAPDLVRLLHGMVLIKGLILLAAAALVWWRLGRPAAAGVAAGYLGALALSAAALGWLWGLHLMLAGAVPFYGGLAGLLLVARRDRGLFVHATNGKVTAMDQAKARPTATAPTRG